MRLLKIIFVSYLLTIFFYSSGQTAHSKQHQLLEWKGKFNANKTYQDSKGYIWFCTSEGLYQYTGKNYIQIKHDSLINKDITSLFYENNTYYIGTSTGELYLYQNDSIITAYHHESYISDIISYKGQIYFSSRGSGLFKIEGEKNINFTKQQNQLSDNYIYDLEIVKENLWIATDNGVSIFNGKKIIDYIDHKKGIPDNIITSLNYDIPNIVWMGTDIKGVVRFDLEKQSFWKFEDWDQGSVTSTALFESGKIMVTTKNNGAYCVDIRNGMEQLSKFDKKHGLINDKTLSVHIDKEKNIWISSAKGVTQFLDGTFMFINKNDQLPFSNIYDLSVAADESIFVCAESGLFHLKKNRDGMIQVNQLLEKELVYTYTSNLLYHDTLWVGTLGSGIYKIPLDSINNFTHYTSELPDQNISSIELTRDRIWFSSLGGGLLYKKHDSSKFESVANFPSKYVYNTFTDSKNITWVAQDGQGIAYIQNDKVKIIPKIDNKFIPDTYGFVEDKTGKIWVNCKNFGVIQLKDFIPSFFKNDNIKANDLKTITQLNDKILFFGNEGISMYDIEKQNIEQYCEDEGVSYLEPNDQVFYNSKNRLFIGTQKGILIFSPTEIDTVQPIIRIKYFKLKNTDFDRNIKNFTHSDNNFTFHIEGLWYQNPQKINYRYKLDGFDVQWSLNPSADIASYPNLPPGEYSFIAEISVDGINWIHSDESKYSFYISPPFYNTWTFRVIMVILIILAIYSFITLREKKLKEDKEILERKVQERTQEVLQQKEEIETQRDQIFEQKEELEKSNKNIKDSIHYALRIQNSILPNDPSLKNLFTDHFILFLPRDIVSGDFYWIHETANYKYIAGIDCTGHGVPGALMSMVGHSKLSEIVSKCHEPSPGYILDELHKGIKKTLNQKSEASTQQNDGMDMAICRFDKNSQEIIAASANRPIYVVTNQNLVQYKGDKFPIGGTQFDNYRQPYKEIKIDHQKDSMLYITSDGYADQFSDDNKKLMVKNLKEHLCSLAQLPLDQQKLALSTKLHNWKKDSEQTDDVLVIGIRL